MAGSEPQGWLSYAGGRQVAFRLGVTCYVGRHVRIQPDREDDLAMRWPGVFGISIIAILIVWRTAVPAEAGAQSSSPAEQAGAAPPALRTGNNGADALLAQILHDGEIDEKALEEIEKRGNAAVSASAYFLAARHEYEARRYDPALRYIQRALELAPDAPGLHAWYAMLLLDRGEPVEAIVQGESAVQLDPASAGAQSILGQAYYRAERLDDAVAAWERALELGPNEEVAKLLAKAKREAAVEGRFIGASTSHFAVRFEGGKPAEALANELSETLERQYYEVGRDLGIRLDTAITVVLYSQQQFSEATEAPSWAGALNDGKMRVPLGDVTRVTPQVEAVLRHELTHSFVHAATTRCPVWLNEGLAQMEEPRGLRNLPAPVQKQVCSGKPRAVPQLSQLEGSFAEFAPDEARVAYAKALAAVEYMRDTYGMDALLRLLSALAAEKDTGKAVEETTGDDYAHLEQQAAQYLVKQACP